MVVLQVCAFAPPTSGNFISALFGLETELKARGIDTIYALPERAKDKIWCQEIQKRTKVYFLPERHARVDINTYRTLRKIFEENDVSIIHSHFELYDIPVAVTAPKKAKIFWHLHNSIQEGYYKSSLSRKILTKIQYRYFGKNTKLLSVSERHGDFAVQLGFKKESEFYVPNGIDTDRIDLEHIDSKKEKNNILMFGHDIYRKGVDLLVNAVREISENNDDLNFKIKVVGQEQCCKYLEDSDKSDYIEFSYPVENISALYSEAKAFLHISRAEGLAYALLEAIYAGLPVICSDIPENLFAKEFKNIIWVQNENINDIADAIKNFAVNYEICSAEDISFNREIIDTKYSLTAWIKQICDFYLH